MPAPIGYTKAPSEAIRFTFDFSAWEALDDDPLASATVAEVDTTGLTIGSPSVPATGKTVEVLISGGDDGTCHTVRCLGTTTGSQIIQGNLLLTVAEPE